MGKGYIGRILHVDLSTKKTESREYDQSFYRTYLGGAGVGSFFIMRGTSADTDPLSARNILVIAPGVATGAAVSGVSRCSVTALSPLTGMIGDSQAGGSIGPALKQAGFDAIVIEGRSSEPVYLLVEGGEARLRPAGHLSGKFSSQVLAELESEFGDSKFNVLQCGPAGEKLVRFACLMADRNDVAGRTGMGAVFGSKKLRAVVIRGGSPVDFADPQGLKSLARRAAERVPDAGFPSTLRKYGTPGVVGAQAESGNFATHNYSRGCIEDYRDLCGESFEPDIGAGETTCFGCAVHCRKRVKAEKPFSLSDRLGGPEFETLGLLGSNLDITDAAAVARANQLCGEYGMDTITTGGLAGYLFECLERGLIPPEAVEDRKLAFGNAEGLFWLIEAIGKREGIGDTLADGFTAAIERFGEQTAPYAVHVKNQGLAVHMLQVKPAIALMYAVCPIGPDHQSCEHDWLLEAGGDDALGLAIVGEGDRYSTSMAKVRMTVLSQHYYSLLDALCLCQFCWGPGNLFSYRELEQLLNSATGWECTFYELIKAGERRTNLMRQVNARRGFTRKHDVLPPRVFDPLPDGPSSGRHVEKETFRDMLDSYYAMMGWDEKTGNPTPGKLAELGLEWTTGLNPRA